MTGKIQIIKVLPDMWPLYKEIRIKTLVQSPEGFGQTLEEIHQVSDEDWRFRVSRIDESTHWIFLATVDGEVVGTISGNIDIWDTNVVNINSFFIDHRFRRLGIGKKLFGHLLSKITKIPDYRIVRLEVVPTQLPAINLYKSFGFAITHKITKKLPSGTDQNRLIMEKSLY